MNRRAFISLSALLPFFGLSNLISCFSKESFNSIFYQKLTKDPNNIIDLHQALRYQVISEKGS